MEDLQVLTQTWSGPLVVAMQILLILLVAWLLQRLVRRTVTRIGERYPVPPELLLPLRGGLRWLIMVSAVHSTSADTPRRSSTMISALTMISQRRPPRSGRSSSGGTG